MKLYDITEIKLDLFHNIILLLGIKCNIIVTVQSLISQNLRFYSMWRIRQITLYKNMLMNASIHRIFLIKLPGSEQLHIIDIIFY